MLGSLIDQENQYFIAEATKSLDLLDSRKASVEEDGLWFGCGTVEKAGRLCEKTIELPASLNIFHYFTVEDLSKDERFKQLPFVSEPPYFRFYAGTPLTTRKGVNIGSLFILDNIVRSKLTEEQEHLMGTIARTVMEHLEMASEARDREKMMRLSSGLNSFVEGKNRIDTGEARPAVVPILKSSAIGGRAVSPKKRSKPGKLRSSAPKASMRRENTGINFVVSCGMLIDDLQVKNLGASPNRLKMMKRTRAPLLTAQRRITTRPFSEPQTFFANHWR